MIGAGRATIAPDALASHRRTLTELLRGRLAMARVAEVARVAVLVAATQRQRLLVVDHGSEAGDATRVAPFAKAFRTIEAALALPLPCPPPQALHDHLWRYADAMSSGTARHAASGVSRR